MCSMPSMRTASFLVAVCFFLLAAGSGAGQRRECSLCGMYLDQYESTVHVLLFADGTRQETCSLACAAKIYAKEKNRIKEFLAADFSTGSLIDAAHAFYLEGSDIPGVMSRISRIAFKSRTEAADVRRKHGGKIVSFQDALKHQLEE